MANAASIEDHGMFSCYSDVVTRARAALWGSLTDLDKAKDYGLKFGRQASHFKATHSVQGSREKKEAGNSSAIAPRLLDGIRWAVASQTLKHALRA